MAWLYKQNTSSNWWIGYRTNGRQHLQSTGTSDEAEAKKVLARFNSMAEAHKAGNLTEGFYLALTQQAPNHLALKKEIEDWRNEARGSTTSETFRRYREITDAFLDWIHAGDSKPLLRDITTDQVQSFLATIRANRSAATANFYRRVLSSVFLRAMKHDKIKSNPVWPVKRFKASRGELIQRRAFTLKELVLMHSKAPDGFWRFMIVAGFYTGLRMGDLATLMWGAVDFGHNVLHLTTRKTGEPLHIPMANSVKRLLRERRTGLGRVKTTDYVWPSQAELYEQQGAGPFSNDFYEQILVPCGLAPKRSHKNTGKGREGKRAVQSVSFHCLRHSFVSFLKLTGSNQAVAKELAGHSSDVVNDLYTHNPEEVLAKAIKKLPEFCQ